MIVEFACLLLVIVLAYVIWQRMAAFKKEYPRSSYRLVDYMSNFYGLQSLGLKQIRGNGVLMVTDDAVVFEMYLPKKQLIIPVSDILSVEKTQEHLGKLGWSLLCVRYQDGNQHETTAWRVKNVDAWIMELDQLRFRKG